MELESYKVILKNLLIRIGSTAYSHKEKGDIRIVNIQHQQLSKVNFP
jgi:hypothetical protein